VVKLPENKTDNRRFEPTVVAFEHVEKIKLNSLNSILWLDFQKKKARIAADL
jgi:hypothetical protein